MSESQRNGHCDEEMIDASSISSSIAGPPGPPGHPGGDPTPCVFDDPRLNSFDRVVCGSKLRVCFDLFNDPVRFAKKTTKAEFLALHKNIGKFNKATWPSKSREKLSPVTWIDKLVRGCRMPLPKEPIRTDFTEIERLVDVSHALQLLNQLLTIDLCQRRYTCQVAFWKGQVLCRIRDLLMANPANLSSTREAVRKAVWDETLRKLNFPFDYRQAQKILRFKAQVDLCPVLIHSNLAPEDMFKHANDIDDAIDCGIL